MMRNYLIFLLSFLIAGLLVLYSAGVSLAVTYPPATQSSNGAAWFSDTYGWRSCQDDTFHLVQQGSPGAWSDEGTEPFQDGWVLLDGYRYVYYIDTSYSYWGQYRCTQVAGVEPVVDCSTKQGEVTTLYIAGKFQDPPYCQNNCEVAQNSGPSMVMTVNSPDDGWQTVVTGTYTGSNCDAVPDTSPTPEPIDCVKLTAYCAAACAKSGVKTNTCDESTNTSTCECVKEVPFPLAMDENGNVAPDQDKDGLGSGAGDDDNDGDGKPNNLDGDVDGNGVPNVSDPDVDGDGESNGGKTDDWTYTDPAGSPNGLGADSDVDGDKLGNGVDGNVDGDQYGNGTDGDIDGDGIPNGSDDDADGDGEPNSTDTIPYGIGGGFGAGTGGTGDASDTDGNGVEDAQEGKPDSDGDGEPDELEGPGDGVSGGCPEGQICIGDGVCQPGEDEHSTDCLDESSYLSTRYAEFKTNIAGKGPFALVDSISPNLSGGDSSYSFDSGQTFGGQREFDFSQYSIVWNGINALLVIIASWSGIKIIVLKRS